jgi:hypothetical protein
MGYAELEERLFARVMAAQDVPAESGRVLAAAARALYERVVDVIRPNPITGTVDSASLTDAVRALGLHSLADRLERIALQERIAARNAAFERLRAEPYTDTGDQFAFAGLILESAQSTGLRPLPRPRRRVTRARRRRRGRGLRH